MIITPASPISLSPDQRAACDVVLSESGPFFVTGPAGSGKSFLIETLRQQRNTAVCATTGIAAQLVRGRTLHSFLSIFPNRGAVQSRWADKRVRNTDLLIIDEISMASAWLLDQMMERFEMANKWPKVVTFGDLLQLPPVDGGFIYENPLWKDFKVIRLTTIHRQKDPEFVAALNDLRVGKESERVTGLIVARRILTGDKLPTDCTQLYALRARVAEMNQERLNELPGKCVRYKTEVLSWKKKKDPKKDEEAFERALKRARYPAEVLELKPGARICMLNNDSEQRWVNGSTGVVTGCDRFSVTVQLDKGGTHSVDRAEEEVSDADGKPELVIYQFPMMLAWALTCHKAQGMTLDRVGVDLGNHFASGMTYVALSRCRTRSGLYLIGGLSPLRVDKRALAICAPEET